MSAAAAPDPRRRDRVRRIPVQVVPVPVVAAGGPRVGVPHRVLHVLQRHPLGAGRGGERVPQRVRRQPLPRPRCPPPGPAAAPAGTPRAGRAGAPVAVTNSGPVAVPRPARYASSAAAAPGVSARRRGLPPLPTNRTLRCPRSQPRSATSRPTSSPTRRPEVGQQRQHRPVPHRRRAAVRARRGQQRVHLAPGSARPWRNGPGDTCGPVRAADRVRVHRAAAWPGSRTSSTARTACGPPSPGPAAGLQARGRTR